MGKVDRIEVHFGDDVATDDVPTKNRTVVIRPGGTVKAVVWEDVAGVLSLQKVDKKREKPKGVTLLPDNSLETDGPDGVCYLEDGVLKCWGGT